MENVLEIEDLSVGFKRRHPKGETEVVRSASLSVKPGQLVGLVGESGSGKSVTALASMGLIGALGGRVTGGSVRLAGQDVTTFTDRQWTTLRGRVAGMVFQQPTRSLNPAFTVGEQIAEVARHHLGLARKPAWNRAVDILDQVRIPNPVQRARDYPHQLSGGMCQRVALAMALVSEPRLLIADEPTTALDVTVQRRILQLISDMRDELGISVLLITHDMGVVAQMCDEVAVMYAGEVVERAPCEELFDQPLHPYTEGLLRSIPRRGQTPGWIRGQVPPPTAMPKGCRFAARCDFVEQGRCTSGPIPLERSSDRGSIRCARWNELSLGGV